jgi:hypothetical protein
MKYFSEGVNLFQELAAGVNLFQELAVGVHHFQPVNLYQSHVIYVCSAVQWNAQLAFITPVQIRYRSGGALIFSPTN